MKLSTPIQTTINSFTLVTALFFSQKDLAQNNKNSLTNKVQSSCGSTVTAGTNTGDLGCVSFVYQNQNVSYQTVRTADGYEWIQQNLGSPKVAESYSEEAAWGDSFQFGRWDDGHQLRNSSTSQSYPMPNNPVGLAQGTAIFYTGGGSPWAGNYTGWWTNPNQNDKWEAKNLSEVTANNGIDPCKALGENWEIPSEADWAKVLADEKVQPKSSDNTDNGITRAYKSNLKIVAAGARKDDSFAFPGVRGYYWTKSASKNPNFYRYFYVSAAVVGYGGDSKSFGYSVRCLNKSTPATLSTQEASENNALIRIYPNPAVDKITIQSNTEIKQITIYNQNGQILCKTKEKEISVSGFPKGVYLVQIEQKNEKITTQKLVKN